MYFGGQILVGALLIGVGATYAIVVSGNLKEAALKREVAAAGAVAEIAKADVAKANETTAVLQREAEQARLQTERLKKELGWREISADQENALAEALRGKSMRIILHWGAGDPEGSNFAHRLAAALNAAGLEIMGGSPIGQLGAERHGISVAGHKRDEVEILADALANVGYGPIDRQIVPAPSGPNAPGQYTDIFIGYRAPPKLQDADRPR
jgi:phytoene dehydrogenase-like protein